jgi:hypothetical protein
MGGWVFKLTKRLGLVRVEPPPPSLIDTYATTTLVVVVVPLALAVLLVYPIWFLLSDASHRRNGNSQQTSVTKDGQQPISTTPVVGKRNGVEQSKKQIGSVSDASKAPPPVQDTSPNMEVDGPSPTMQSNSAFHIGTRANRTAKEQQRMDKMHDTFRRVGLMSRQKRVSQQISSRIEKNKGTAGGSSRAYGNAQAHESEPSASDLLKAWRTKDQTQPKMIGKLY